MRVAYIVAMWCLLGGCVTSQAVTSPETLDAMSEDEFGRYLGRVHAEVTDYALALLEEEDIDLDDLAKAEAVLRSVSQGGLGIGFARSLIDVFEVEGYVRLAVSAAVQYLDSQLEARGAYGPGGLTERGKAVLEAAADAVQGVAGAEPIPD